MISLVCLDLAGTTVSDDGVVIEAFREAIRAVGEDPSSERGDQMMTYVRETMGTSKITVFNALLENPAKAQAANIAFEQAYDRAIKEHRVHPIEGALEAIEELRALQIKVALLTGFSRATLDNMIDALGWKDLADTTLCPAPDVRGRPYPDMILRAFMDLSLTDVRTMAVVGDTAADMQSGKRSGASLVAGVLTGADDEIRLHDAGADVVLASVALLPSVILKHNR